MNKELLFTFILFTLCGVHGQLNSGYQPQPRGGHFIKNGQYNNQAPTQAANNIIRSPNSYNVIGNVAENTYGNSAVNSILGSRVSDTAVNSIIITENSLGSSYNVIGNRALNTHGGVANSIVNNP